MIYVFQFMGLWALVIVGWTLFGSIFVRAFMWAEVQSMMYRTGWSEEVAQANIDASYDSNTFWIFSMFWPIAAFLLLIFALNTIGNAMIGK